MKATDIRIGNLVAVPETVILGIGSEKLMTVSVASIGKTGLTITAENGNFDYKYEHVAGIPIKFEWPMQFNLPCGYRLTDLCNGEFVFEIECTELVSPIKITWFGVSIVKYVHQLQNLHFALTGEELKVVM